MDRLLKLPLSDGPTPNNVLLRGLEIMEIPEKYQEFCREVAKLAVKLNVDSAQITLRPGFNEDWSGDIQANWNMGRHGSESHRIVITSTVRIHTDLSGDPDGFHK